MTNWNERICFITSFSRQAEEGAGILFAPIFKRTPLCRAHAKHPGVSRREAQIHTERETNERERDERERSGYSRRPPLLISSERSLEAHMASSSVVSAGDFHTIGIAAGKLYRWGWCAGGVMTEYFVPTLVRAGGLGEKRVVAAAAGHNHILTLTDEGGGLRHGRRAKYII